MRIHHQLAVSVYASFIIFTWLSFFFGPNGYMEMKRLKLYKDKMVANNSRMEMINKKLETDFTELESSKEAVALEARSLGYYHDDEGVFFIEGYRPESKGYQIGSLYRRYQSRPYNIRVIRYISIISGLIIFLFMILFGRKKYAYTVNRRRYSEA